MNTWEQVLVIILASFLAVFLILGIIVLIKVIQVLQNIKHITQKAERIADKAEAVGEFFEASAGPAAIGKLLFNIIHTVKERKQGKDKT